MPVNGQEQSRRSDGLFGLEHQKGTLDDHTYEAYLSYFASVVITPGPRNRTSLAGFALQFLHLHE